MNFLPEWAILNVCLLGATAILALPVAVSRCRNPGFLIAWSKFCVGKTFAFPCSARTGMLLKYLPALALLGATADWSSLTTWMTAAHFGKRVFEVLFVHSFVGSPVEDLVSSALIGFPYYTLMAWAFTMNGVSATGPVFGLGVACFCAGLLGNLWHHLLLAKLRKPGSEHLVTVGKYKIPEGGLFGLVSCPHYFFESLGFGGIALVAMHVIPLAWTLQMTIFLLAHSKATTRWYEDKFGDKWPARKHMIPYVF